MSENMAKDMACMLDNFGPIAWLNAKCEDGALVKGAIKGCVSLKDGMVNGMADAKSGLTDFVKDPAGKLGHSKDGPTIARAQELEHGVGLSAQRAALRDGDSNLGTQSKDAPEQATYATLCSGLDLSKCNGIQVDKTHLTGAHYEQISSVTAVAAMSQAKFQQVQTQNQGMAMST